ncbi:hypothetical protein NDU88_005093 [Pleurodeles waltl]|uniref:Hexosyltransferase n=1 Tax=Pleurodeles waltl TaxID=8319 RepID=A0AAV7T9Z7_PLEWA|nr:hypothetical protein NDU88_005093 [Pleurodeles waltl]
MHLLDAVFLNNMPTPTRFMFSALQIQQFLVVFLPGQCETMKGSLKECQMFLCVGVSMLASSIFVIHIFSDVKIDIWEKHQINTQTNVWTTKASILEKITVLPAKTRHLLIPNYSYNYRFLLNQPDKCREKVPFLVMLVVSKATDIDTRHLIRATWGNETIIPGVVIKRLFLVGVDPLFTIPLQQALQEESFVFQDILQQDFLDSYHNLTVKTMMGMEWVAKYCPTASYVLKIDTDVFLNVDFLVNDLLKPKGPTRLNYFTGRILNTGPIRDKAHKKWYIPKEVYPSDKYPPYCAGPIYLFSGDMATKIYNVAQLIPPFPLEDTFVGFCLHEMGIKITKPPRAAFHGHKMTFDRCKFYKLASVHPFSHNELLKVWPGFLPKNETTCLERAPKSTNA